MEISKDEAKLLYNICKDFMTNHKEAYDNTIKYIRYTNLIEKTKKKIIALNDQLEKYHLNEQIYNNSLINMHLHDKIKVIEEQIFFFWEDISYYYNTLAKMNPSEDIYIKYVYCESDIQRFEKILSM